MENNAVRGFVLPSGDYTETYDNLAEVIPGALEIGLRGSQFDDWSGSGWVRNVERENLAFNAQIYEQMDVLDLKSIRALREGDAVRVASLESQAEALRVLLKK